MTLVVKGYKELSRAMVRAPKDVRREWRTKMRQVGEEVRSDSQQNFSGYGPARARQSHADSAEGYRVVVRQRGVEVDSRRRKTTGKHPEYGQAQMRHGLVPGLEENKLRLYVKLEQAMVEVVAALERRSL